MSNGHVVYVGTFTRDRGVGIHIYDLVDNYLVERSVVTVHNPTDLNINRKKKVLYSIADEGVVAFRILKDGNLSKINELWTGGMRGSYLTTDKNGRFLFSAGHYEGTVTVIKLNEDGSLGEVVETIYHKGLNIGVAKRGTEPHVISLKFTPDERFICAVDSGLDRIYIYEIDYLTGKLEEVNIIRGHLDSSPRKIRFSANYKYAYVLCELKRCVDVYSIRKQEGVPEFELIQTISTVEVEDGEYCSASDMKVCPDGKTMICSNAGSNSVAVFEINKETGLLSEICNLKISGDYPKTLAFLPDCKHFITLNQESNEMVIFSMKNNEPYFLMEGKPLKIQTPNCIQFYELED